MPQTVKEQTRERLLFFSESVHFTCGLDAFFGTQYNEKKKDHRKSDMIVFDFEWNRGYDKTPLDEILQIGAVRVDSLGGPVTDTFNVYIRPAVHKRFDPGARKLPELQASLESHVTFCSAMEAFRAWCGAETVFASWGGDDFKSLERNCEYWKVPAMRPGETYDLQKAFSYLVGTRQQVALSRAVEYCGIPDVFDFHNALNDSLYTAVVAQWLTPEVVNASPVRELPTFCKCPFPRQPRNKIGPFPTIEGVLNDRGGRKAVCPLCGRKTWVLRWRYSTPRQYYAAFDCPEHGKFLCRLTLTSTDGSQWSGRVTVPIITPVLLQEYQRALKAKRQHICKGDRRKRHRHKCRRKRGGLESTQKPQST